MKGEGLPERENSKHIELTVGRSMICSRSQKTSTYREREREDGEKGELDKSRLVDKSRLMAVGVRSSSSVGTVKDWKHGPESSEMLPKRMA